MDYATNDGATTSGETVRPSFGGTAGMMFPVVLKGLFLTIVTLGIYRFWYMTDVRRFLWNNTEVGGDYLEYTGRGVELFIGFLIALAVLVPLYAFLYVAIFQLGPTAQVVAQFVFFLIIAILAQFALFRARRYRLTRTIWRGIRFQQTGSGFAYAFRSLAWLLLVILTIGLAYPWMRASLERYKMVNTWYGDQQGAFAATGGSLFLKGLLVWIAAVLVIFGPPMVLAALESSKAISASSPIHALLALSVIGVVVIGPVYWAVEYRWWANGCSIGPATVRCDLGLFAFFKVYLGYLGVAILFGIIVGAIGALIFFTLNGSGAFASARVGAPPPIGLMIIFGAFYFLVALVFAALWQVFGIRPIWRKSFESCEIHSLGAMMAAQSATPESNAFGEGVADAIDFGGF